MINFKKNVALLLTLIMILSLMCACKKDDEIEPTVAPTDDVVEQDPILFEEDVKEQKLETAQLTLYALENDVEIMLDSEHFGTIRNLIHVGSDEVESESTKFITELQKIETSFVGTLNNICYGDTLNISPISGESMKMRCRLFGDTINLSVSTREASSVYMSMMNRLAGAKDVVGMFSYDSTDPINERTMHIVIDGHLQEKGDIEVYRNENGYIVSSTSMMESLTVTVSGLGDELDGENVMVDSMEQACVYEIVISTDGNVTVEPKTE